MTSGPYLTALEAAARGKTRPTWEHKIVWLQGDLPINPPIDVFIEQAHRMLAALAGEGWELVSVVNHMAYLKRPAT
jgi:hypothetical protein